MLKCREVSELGSEFIDGRLGLRSRLAVLAHLGLCPHCRRYLKQLRLTSETLQRLPPEDEPNAPAILEAIRQPPDGPKA
ncbi:anti-sigma factor family protein [Azotobacter salinestris]|uniref:anti-sigma factor family protein n=1 Tax=Azotobacter salinestris TaxID=69964 RepID=UPI0032DEAEDF